ncbi:MAG: DUF4419 domain-containing protein [Desulfuromonadaceae bacterium]
MKQKVFGILLVGICLLHVDAALAKNSRFKVAEVTVAENLLPTTSYRQALEQRIGSPAEAISAADKGLIVSSIHPFVQAVYSAFNEHRPLTLSPDMVWLLIAQGFAQHVNNNSEALRKKFVKHDGKKVIEVRRDDFIKGKPDNPWEQVFPEFTNGIKKHVGPDLHNVVVASFSTTGNIEKAAFEITLMDSMKSYFEYRLNTLCGIPFVTLEGTPEDWRLIIEKAKALRQFELDWWIDELVPVLEQFARASQGKVDAAFWNGMFKYIPPRGASGTVSYVNGWIVKFFPYILYFAQFWGPN